MSRAALRVPTHGSSAPDSRSHPGRTAFASGDDRGQAGGPGGVFVSGEISVQLGSGQAVHGGLAGAHPAGVEADHVETGAHRGGDRGAGLQRVADAESRRGRRG